MSDINNLLKNISTKLDIIKTAIAEIVSDINTFIPNPTPIPEPIPVNPPHPTIFPFMIDIGTAPKWLDTTLPEVNITSYPYPIFLDSDESYFINSDGKKTPVTKVLWDFDDNGATSTNRFGTHIYINPGTYQVKLTVFDDKGDSHSTSHIINVKERSGTKYYVSPNGNDNNDGLSTTTAWKTATKAFNNLISYKPGDTVLFESSHEYELAAGISIDSLTQRIFGNVHFTSFGGRAKLKLTGNGWIFNSGWNGLYNLSFSNFDIIGNGAASFINIFRNSYNIMLYNSSFIDVHQFFNIQGQETEDRNYIKNVFLHNVVGGLAEPIETLKYNVENLEGGKFASRHIALFFRGNNISQKNNSIYRTGNHVHYGSNIKFGVIENCKYCYPAWGRHALRLSGAVMDGINDFTNDVYNPSGPVYVNNCEFIGCVSEIPSTYGVVDEEKSRPHNAGLYTRLLVDINPNTAKQQLIKDVTFRDNLVKDCQTFIQFSSCHNIKFYKNLFNTNDNLNFAYPRFSFGHGFETIPMSSIEFHDNEIISKDLGRSGQGNPIFYFAPYKSYLTSDGTAKTNHTFISVYRNTIKSDGNFIYIMYGPMADKTFTNLQDYGNYTIKSYYTAENHLYVIDNMISRPCIRLGVGFQSSPPSNVFTIEKIRELFPYANLEVGTTITKN